ncbi:MAG: carbohydrate binding family 9 domain-containing protein, partial [Myxococcota bacterium]
MAALLFLASVAAGEEAKNPRPRARALLVVEPPEIDGRLDEAMWQAAERLQPLTQIVPIEGATPSQPTDVRIVRTAGALYFGIRCYDDHPDEIIARVMEQDASLRGDDRVGLTLDTFRDQRSSYFFAVNPRGSRFEGLIEYNDFEENWETIWQARARIDDQGWTVEIEIPFESISFNPS